MWGGYKANPSRFLFAVFFAKKEEKTKKRLTKREKFLIIELERF